MSEVLENTGSGKADGDKARPQMPANIRVRFCPSPTGIPHVGMVRIALFNWA